MNPQGRSLKKIRREIEIDPQNLRKFESLRLENENRLPHMSSGDS